MTNFFRKAIFYIAAIWAAVTLNFFIPRFMPGDPVQSMYTRFQGQLPADAMDSLYKLLHYTPGTPLWTQYIGYWADLFHGNLGLSFRNYPTPVVQVIADALPWTIALVGMATVIAFALGTLIGMLTGWRRGGVSEMVIPVTTFFSAMPYFWIALVLIAFFSIHLGWLPFAFGYDPSLRPGFTWAFIGSAAQHALLPALTIVISSIAGWILSMRNMMVTVSSEDFVTVAQAKGLPEGQVMFRYAARNAILPQISGFALSLGFVVSGALVMEQVFSYPGIGFRLLQAVGSKDYPLMQGIFLVITLAVILANILADVVYAILDPRTRKD